MPQNPHIVIISEEDYWNRYRQLAKRFVANFKKFESEAPDEVVKAGPVLPEGQPG